MMKYKEIKVDVYNSRIRIFVGNHNLIAPCMRSLKMDESIINAVLTTDFFNTDGLALDCDNGNQVIWLESISLRNIAKLARNISVAAHESFHATSYLLNDRGVEYITNKSAGNEAFAYMIGLIIEHIFNKEGWKVFKNKKHVKNRNS